MTSAERISFKASVKETLVRLEKELQELEKELQPIAPECALGTLSRFEMMQDQERIHTTYLVVKQQFDALTYTYRHIDDEGFGLCCVCDEEIATARLLAVPETRMCIDCASEEER